MKRIIISSIFILFLFEAKSTKIPLDTIKYHLVSFIKEIDTMKVHEDCSINDFPNFLICDRKLGTITEGKEGVFAFGLLSSGDLTHFLLIEKDHFQILNMKDSIEKNILKLSDFFKRNKQYSKHDILFYINDVITTHQNNEMYIKNYKGIVK